MMLGIERRREVCEGSPELGQASMVHAGVSSTRLSSPAAQLLNGRRAFDVMACASLAHAPRHAHTAMTTCEPTVL
jgi:hypothetical protein